jgi:hypothetical protein
MSFVNSWCKWGTNGSSAASSSLKNLAGQTNVVKDLDRILLSWTSA